MQVTPAALGSALLLFLLECATLADSSLHASRLQNVVASEHLQQLQPDVRMSTWGCLHAGKYVHVQVSQRACLPVTCASPEAATAETIHNIHSLHSNVLIIARTCLVLMGLRFSERPDKRCSPYHTSLPE